MRKGRIFFYILILAGAFLLFFNIFGRQPDLTYSELTDLFAEGKVRSFVISDNVVTVTLKESKDNKDKLTAELADVDRFLDEVGPYIKAQKIPHDIKKSADPDAFSLIIPLVIVGFILLLVWAFFSNRGGSNSHLNNFGRARTVLGVPDGKKVTFEDVAGADEEKEELQEIVDFLRDPKKYTEIGARIPHGI